MEIMPLKIVGDSGGGSVYNKINPEQTVNAVMVDNALISFMGSELVDSFEGVARGYYTSTILDAQIAVFGKKVYKFNYPIKEEIGELETVVGSVQFAENFNNQIALTDGEKYYVYNYLTNTFEIVEPSLVLRNGVLEEITLENPLQDGETPIKLSCLTFDDQRGYIFGGVKDSNTFIYTSPNDATTFDPFNSGQIGNDVVVSVKNFGSLLFVIGSTRTQIWRDTGAAFTPYQKDGSTTILFGALNKDAVSAGFGYIIWIATSPDGNITVVAGQGGAPQRILSAKIQFELSNLTQPFVCDSSIFQEYGIVWYQVTFENDDLTLLIDLNNAKFYYLTNEANQPHPLKYLTFFKNKYLFQSRYDSNVYWLSSEFPTLNGRNIERTRISDMTRFPSLYGRRIIYLELFVEQGDGEIPTLCYVATSLDGGASFGNNVPLPFESLGKRRALARLNNIGLAREICFRFLFAGPNRLVVISAQMGVE